MSSENKPEKKPTFMHTAIAGVLIGLAITNTYKIFNNSDRAGPKVTPEHRLAEAVDSNIELKAAMMMSLERVMLALQTDHEKTCKEGLDGPVFAEADKNNLSVDLIVSRLIASDAKRSGNILNAELEKEARFIQEASALGADIGEFSNILALGMTKKIFDDSPDDFSTRARDGMLEFRALGEDAFALGEIRGCAIDMRLIGVSKEIVLKTSDAYTKMRNLVHAANAPVGEKDDIFLNVPETSRPALAPGVVRFRTEGPFTVIAELDESQAATCDAFNAAVAQPLPEWAVGGGALPPDPARRWSCTKQDSGGSATGKATYFLRYNAVFEGAVVQGRH